MGGWSSAMRVHQVARKSLAQRSAIPAAIRAAPREKPASGAAAGRQATPPRRAAASYRTTATREIERCVPARTTTK